MVARAPRRFAEVYCKETDGFGSGYVLGGGLMLTARHVIRPRGKTLAGPPAVETRPFTEAATGADWQPASLVWPPLDDVRRDDLPDAALLEMRAPPPGLERPVLLGLAHLAEEAELRVHAVGFPAFRAIINEETKRKRRDTETIKGYVEPSTALASGRLEITKVSSDRGEPIDPDLRWNGFSGAALLAEGRVIGVVETRVTQGRVEFLAQRVDALLLEPTFADAVRGAASAPALARPSFELSGTATDDVAQGAVESYRLAADRGDAEGQHKLGVFYQEGHGGLPRDDREAARLFRLAADQGHAGAQNDLGWFYAHGHGGLPQDDREAARLFRLAAEQGFPRGQGNLAWFYDNGRGGLPRDDREAARLFRLAADQGESWATTNLGMFHEQGRGGLAPDLQEAMRLYRRAAMMGNEVAQAHLRRLGRAW